VTAKFEAAVEKMKEANESIAASRRELTILTDRHREVADRLVKLEESIGEKKAHYNEVTIQISSALNCCIIFYWSFGSSFQLVSGPQRLGMQLCNCRRGSRVSKTFQFSLCVKSWHRC
jgi:ABC-type siderophore export system fused ATPase/permease subunit